MRAVDQSFKARAKVADLTPHPRNPRKGDTAAIAASIDANGFYGAVLVQKSTGHVLAGNHRLLAAQAAGATEIPAIFVDVTDEEALRILLADNRTSDDATYDDGLLRDLLLELVSAPTDVEFAGTNVDVAGLIGTGFTPDDLAALTATPDEPAERKEPERIIGYQLIFDNEGQQKAWNAYLRWLRANVDGETLAERLIVHLGSVVVEVPAPWTPPTGSSSTTTSASP